MSVALLLRNNSKRKSPTCSAQLHLPTHDLFWANLKVQLDLPPLGLLIFWSRLETWVHGPIEYIGSSPSQLKPRLNTNSKLIRVHSWVHGNSVHRVESPWRHFHVRQPPSRPPDCRKVLACLRRLQEPGKYFKSRKQSRLNQHLHSTAITSGALATNYLSEWNVVPLISCRAPVSFTSRHVRRSVPQSHQATHYIDRHLTAVKMSHSVPL